MLFEELLRSWVEARSKVRLHLDLELGSEKKNLHDLELRRVLLLDSLIQAALEFGSVPALVLLLSQW